MPTMTDTFSLLLFQYNDDEATEALLDSANSVDTDPTVAQVEQVLRYPCDVLEAQ